MNNANRFFQADQSKWVKRLDVGPLGKRTLADATRKIPSVVFWTFDGSKDHRVARLEAHYRAVFDDLDGLREHRQTTAKAGKLTPLGVTEAVAERAMVKAIPTVRRAKAAADAIKAEIKLRIDGLKLADPEDGKKAQYDETRKMLLSKLPDERNKIVQQNRHDPDFARAIALMPEYLSGVGDMVHRNIRGEQLEREHGEALAELRDLAEPIQVLERLADVAREETRQIMGVDKPTFEKIATVAERNGGRLPFRVDIERNWQGQDVEVAKVLDLSTGAWRRATGDEVEKSATNSAGMAA